jgi:hypothetical protein
VTRPPTRSLARCAAAWTVVATLATTPACHHHAAKDPDNFIGRAQAIPRRATRPDADAKKYPGLRSSLVAVVPDKSVGPFLARKGDIAMAAYLGPDDSGGRRVVSVPLEYDGVPKEAKVVSSTLADSTTLVLRASGGETPGFLAAWTELTDRGEALSVVGVAADGSPTVPPIELARITDDIVWVEIVPTPRGEICVWAEETRNSDATIVAVPLDPIGKPRGVPSRVARGATAWQVVPTMAGAGLAIVTAAADKSGKPVPGSSVGWLKLDTEARPVGTILSVATSPAKITDVDMAPIGDSVVLAWTDRSTPDPELWLAAIDGEGRLKPAHTVTARLGGAKLSAIAGSKAGGVVAWEEARKRPRVNRRIHLAKVDKDGAVGTEGAVFEAEPSGVPELAMLSDGVAVLTRTRTCPDPLAPGDTPCADTPIVPTFVRFDFGLHAAQTEPVRIDESVNIATLAWSMSCEGDQCLVLAAGDEAPAKVRVIEMTEMPNRWHAPVPPAAWAAGPKPLGVDTVQGGDLFADVAAAPTDGGTLVASVTTGGDAAARGAGAGHTSETSNGTLSIRLLDPNGVPKGPPKTITKRALSAGGVALAAMPKGDGAVVAWVAREGQNGQIHLTRVDKQGQRMKDVQLTTSRGDAGDVAIVWSGGGFTVAWVDTRDGNGEVYATKVDPDLNRMAREERITNAPGDASDVALLAPILTAPEAGAPARAGDVWLAWADPRESPHDGFADVFVAKLSGTSAKPVAPESRVLATAAHSRSPSLAWDQDEKHADIAWIEEAPMSSGSENSGAYGAMIGVLDDNGHLVGDALRTRGAGDGYPTMVALERGPGDLHVVLARAARDDLSLDALEVTRTKDPSPSLLFVLDGPPTLDISLSLLGGAVFFNDEGVDVADGRTRRLAVAWQH